RPLDRARHLAVLMAAAAVLLVAASMSVAMRPSLSGTSLVFVVPAVPYVLFTILALFRMRKDGTLSEKFRPRSGDLTFGFVVTVVLYAAAHLPTMVLLRDPFAGPNPLVVLAALGCGLVWGLVVARTGRLPVAIVSHALFTWGVVLQFPLWRLA